MGAENSTDRKAFVSVANRNWSDLVRHVNRSVLGNAAPAASADVDRIRVRVRAGSVHVMFGHLVHWLMVRSQTWRVPGSQFATVALVVLVSLVLRSGTDARSPGMTTVTGEKPIARVAPLHDCMLVFRFGNDLQYSPPLGSSEARSVNAAGQVVGWVMNEDRTVNAALWDRDGTMKSLGTLGGRNSCALDINSAGTVVGWADTASGEAHAFAWSDGVMNDLGAKRTDLTVAYAINDPGDIVGMSWPIAAGPGSSMGRAVEWTNRTALDLGKCLDVQCSAGLDINNAGLVVGWTVDEDYTPHAYLWDGADRLDLGARLPGASEARGINVHGDVVGWAETAGGERHATMWSGGVMMDLGLPGWRSVANDIADNGAIAGAEASTVYDLQPVVWAEGEKFELGSLGGHFGEAYATNVEGDVVGWSETRTGIPHAFVWRDGHLVDLTPES